MAFREVVGTWGTRIGFGGAALFGPAVGFVEKTTGVWSWDLNEDTAVFFAVVGLASFIFGGPRPVAHSGRKKED